METRYTEAKAAAAAARLSSRAAVTSMHDANAVALITSTNDRDLLAAILSYLEWDQVIEVRLCCHAWKQAVAITPVACVDVLVKDGETISLDRIANALPRTQKFCLRLGLFGDDIDVAVRLGDDAPDEGEIVGQAVDPVLDIAPVLQFRHLRHLVLVSCNLQGRHQNLFAVDLLRNLESLDLSYNEDLLMDWSRLGNCRSLRHLRLDVCDLVGPQPDLFSAPCLRHLETLSLEQNFRLEWDWSCLENCVVLQKLECSHNDLLTGDLTQLYHLRHSLQELICDYCPGVKGRLDDLYPFKSLRRLSLCNVTGVTGDIRTIGPHDFLTLQEWELPDTVVGGNYWFSSIEDVPTIMQASHALMQRNQSFPMMRLHWSYLRIVGELAPGSSQYYDLPHRPQPPFMIERVRAGKRRLGWRWTNGLSGGACHAHWLQDGNVEHDDDDDIQRDMQSLEENVQHFAGFYQPPSEEQYREKFVSTTSALQ